jgi:signal transduction histidine kinase
VFKRIRQLRISLAQKCQLLFGTAVLMIIAAALFVPWQRMEQLMAQLNDNAAEMLVQRAIEEHLLAVGQQSPPGPVPSSRTLPPTTQPSRFDPRNLIPPRLLLVHDQPDPETFTRFERSAIRQIRDRIGPATKPSEPISIGRLADDSARYRFVRTEVGCLRCHAAPSPSPLATALATPTTQPTFLSLVSIDIPSQVSANQSLLNRVFILSAGVLAGTLAIVTFYLITTRLILQPVRVLQETAEKVSQGDLNIRSDISTGDEFQQLSETFNTMLANLKRSSDQLQAVNKSLDLKLGQLAETNVALFESNRLKSEFLANVSHELRTPLNSILGFAQLLKDVSPTDDPKLSRYIGNILTSGNNLLDLINDLLDLAKIEAGKMEVRSEPLSLPDLLEALIGLLKPLCEPKRLVIGSRIGSDVPILQTDPAKLQQILYNFLSNAIKFSPNAGKIDLIAERVGEDRVRVSVRDRGPGIAPDKQEELFEKFRQIDGTITRQHSGTGLGLAISRELASLLGGMVGVQSELGKGATFYVELPQTITASSHDLREKLILND